MSIDVSLPKYLYQSSSEMVLTITRKMAIAYFDQVELALIKCSLLQMY
ncbi:hypothetical protein [aff. Roholtiella sp. LEGE 12411]|nr:hypothetical protein [aff. Roholtiella sp. LEGE 12411]MBE9035901.1 hypothetical protein [aff. Roholtiella sp. LEGE 12411]